MHTQNLPMHRTAMAAAGDSLGAGATRGPWGRAGPGSQGPSHAPARQQAGWGQPQPWALVISLGMGLGRGQGGMWACVRAWCGRAHGWLAVLWCSWGRDRQHWGAETGPWAVGRAGGDPGECRWGL